MYLCAGQIEDRIEVVLSGLGNENFIYPLAERIREIHLGQALFSDGEIADGQIPLAANQVGNQVFPWGGEDHQVYFEGFGLVFFIDELFEKLDQFIAGTARLGAVEEIKGS